MEQEITIIGMLPTTAAPLTEQSSTLGPTAIADAAAVLCAFAVALLHARRFIACRGTVTTKDESGIFVVGVVWDWMCATDPFASWSFLPLHVLAVVAACSWPLLALGRRPSVRYAEIFIGAYSMCWFSPAHPFAASKDCVDSDAGCTGWAASGECEKNKDFMLKTCRKACGACVGDGSDGSFHAHLQALGPRAVATGAGCALLILASARLLLSGLSEKSQERVAGIARLAARPIAITFAFLMRTPLAPILRLLLRLLRGGFGAVGSLLRYVVRTSVGLLQLVRRRLILILGGQVERGDGGGIDGLFDDLKGR